MNKRFLSLILMVFAISVTSSYAWNWDTHQAIVDKLYSDMPRDLQIKLNLSLMEEGSIAPDKVLHNNIFHHYPPSYNLALVAINEGVDWNDISYNFGIATHYISDSFSAPHYITKEPYNLHSEFEKQVGKYISKIDCNDYNIDLKTGLENGSLNYKDWGDWLLTKDKTIPEKEVDSAMKVVYSVAIDKFKFSCNKKTEVEYITEIVDFNDILKFSEYLGGVLLLYIFYRTIKRFKYKK